MVVALGKAGDWGVAAAEFAVAGMSCFRELAVVVRALVCSGN